MVWNHCKEIHKSIRNPRGGSCYFWGVVVLAKKIWTWACDQLKADNWSADIFRQKKTRDVDELTPERCGLWKLPIGHNMDVSYQVKDRLRAAILARNCDISWWFPFGGDGRADGRTVPKFLACIVNQIFLPMELRLRVTLNARGINLS